MKQTITEQYNRLVFSLLNVFEENDNYRTPYFTPTQIIKYNLCKTQKTKDKWLLSCINDRKDTIKTKQIIMSLGRKRAWEYLEEGSDEISEKIENYIKISKAEKNKYAEVFTPYELVETMLNRYPVEDWSNPHLKWLDMTNGIGNFSWRIIIRLFKGLKNVSGYECPETRYKHIIENMIYVCDIQTKNMFLWLKRIDYYNEYSTKYYFGDSLKNTEWENIKFDRITMNPPYNDGDKPEEANKLYPKFMHKALLSLKDGGYLNMVTPNAWFTDTADIGKGKTGISLLSEFKKYNLLYLNTKSDEIKKKYFKDANSTFCYYLVQKSNNYTTTNINGLDIDIRKFPSLPAIAETHSFSIISKYLTKSDGLDKFKWIDQNHNLLDEEKNKTKTADLKEETNILKYKNYHTPALAKGAKKLGLIDYTYIYSSNKHLYQDVSKIMVSISGEFKPIKDSGVVGFSNMCLSIITEEVDRTYFNLNNTLFKFLMKAIGRSAGFVNRKFLITLPKLPDAIKSDEDVFNFYGIDSDEIIFMNKVISGEYNKEIKIEGGKEKKPRKKKSPQYD